MARLTKLERDALGWVVSEVQAGDTYAFFNHGVDLPDDESEYTREHKHAIKLAKALDSAATKLRV